jgi:hypothetical protein
MPSPTKQQVKKMIENRKTGLYITTETRDEVRVVLSQMSPTDLVLTLIRKHGVFSCYDKREWLAQVADWKQLGAECLKCNIRPVPVEAGMGEGLWMMVIQPAGGIDNMCPLAMACSVMVSGFTYIAKDKAPFELAWAVLGRKE